ncbi:MAG: cell division protein ZapA [Rubrivivax sp.]
MKQVEVTILGQGYILGCPEGGEARLGAAVAAVDREMSAIRDAGKIKARDRIAVLAALNLAYQLSEQAARGEREERARASERQELAEQGTATAATPSARDADADLGLGPLISRLDAALNDGRLI